MNSTRTHRLHVPVLSKRGMVQVWLLRFVAVASTHLALTGSSSPLEVSKHATLIEAILVALDGTGVAVRPDRSLTVRFAWHPLAWVNKLEDWWMQKDSMFRSSVSGGNTRWYSDSAHQDLTSLSQDYTWKARFSSSMLASAWFVLAVAFPEQQQGRLWAIAAVASNHAEATYATRAQ